MNDNVHEYYKEFTDGFTPSGHFHKVLSLHESPEMEWEKISDLAPSLPRGWYELSRLPSEDRIEFVRDYWLSKLPYIPHVHESLTKFFLTLDNIGIYVTQKTYEDSFNAQLVYSLKENQGFYHGYPPLQEKKILDLERKFEALVLPLNYLLPEDYLAFLEIHDGFSKYTDTGLIKSEELEGYYLNFQKFLEKDGILEEMVGKKEKEVNPRSLIPFYESFGLHSYQCFWGEWYPEQEMGNVYYSGIENNLSDIENKEEWLDNMAFPTFLDWIVFYLESVLND